MLDKKIKVVKEIMASEVNSEDIRITTNLEEAKKLQMLIPLFKAGDLDSMIESRSQVLEIEEEGLLS